MTYTPDTDIEKLSARYGAQAAARRARWAGKKSGIAIWGSKREKRELAEIIAYAEEHSTVARQALAWARAHNLVISADTLDDKTRGYYVDGVVTLCLPSKNAKFRHVNMADYTEVLVHEIRHAWQDYYGLLSKNIGASRLRMADRLMMNALYEADAYAMGQLAYKECVRFKGVQNHAGALRFDFMQWFKRHAACYHQNQTEHAVARNTLLHRAVTACFNAVSGRAGTPTPVNWSHYLARLGRSFDGFDYIASFSAARRDELMNDILTPTRALDQFNAVAKSKKPSQAKRLDIADRKRTVTRARAMRGAA